MFDAIKEWLSNLLGGGVSEHVENIQQQAGDAAQNVQEDAAQKVEEVKDNLPNQQ